MVQYVQWPGEQDNHTVRDGQVRDGQVIDFHSDSEVRREGA